MPIIYILYLTLIFLHFSAKMVHMSKLLFFFFFSLKTDADSAVVGEHGEVDFKEDSKFSELLKKGDAVSDFAKSKTIQEQRQYLPIYSVRDELLQVLFSPLVYVCLLLL